MKKGLVLEGGAMRGMFTCGVLDVFMEEGIDFDGAVGTSAGACFGCNIKSKQPKRVIRYNVKYGRDPRYASFRNLILEGNYFGKDFCYDELPFKLDIFDEETYKNNPMKFYACATNVETGKPVYHDVKTGNRKDCEWFRASASMPLFSNIVKIDGYKLLDGGVTDSIPIKFMEKRGYDRNVVVLTQPASFTKKPNSLMPIIRGVYWKYPKLVKAMEYRHVDYNETVRYIREKERLGELFVIAPEESLHISHIEKRPKELIRVYKTGRRAAKKRLKELREYLGE